MAVYTTLSAAKLYLGETGTSNDALLTALLDAAEDAVNVYCLGKTGVSLLTTTYTRERVDGGTAELVLAHGPITAVATIEIGPSTTYTTLYNSALPDAQNSVLVTQLDGRIVRLSTIVGEPVGLFMQQGPLVNRKDILVTYTAGYATTPPSLALAVWKIVATMFSTTKRAAEGVSRYKTGEVEVDFEGSRSSSSPTYYLSKDIEQLLRPFRQYA